MSKRQRCSALLFSILAFMLAINIRPGFAQSTNTATAESDHAQQRYYTELAKVPEKDRNRSNPMEADAHALAAGQKLFEQHCATCHGNNAAGGRKGPSLRAPEVRSATPGALFWILTNGVVRRGMPVWSKLPEQQRWQIVSYLKSLN